MRASPQHASGTHRPSQPFSLSRMGDFGRHAAVGEKHRDDAAPDQTNQEASNLAGRDLSQVPLSPTDGPSGRTAGGSWATTVPRPQIAQTSLSVGTVNDPLEHEADRIADHVMANPASAAAGSEVPNMLRGGTRPAMMEGLAPARVIEVVSTPGRPLDPGLRQSMEQRFGHDFSSVRVHAGAAAEQSSRDLRAKAYSAGLHLVFGPNQFAPGTRDGQRLIAHELAHVVQHSYGVNGNGVAGQVVRRKPDAGADAQPVPVPQDSGTRAPTPAPAPGVVPPSPPPPRTPPRAPAPPPPVATIAGVTFRGSSDRIAPTQTATVPVTLTNLPSGGTAAIDVEGSGGANGTARITAGASLSGSGNVTVRGDTQTTPGNAGNLKIRATVGGTVAGRSAGFTVAAWPADFTTSRVNDIDSGGGVGVAASNAWVSDGSGAVSELNETERTERVDIGSRDNPPFTSGAGTSTTSGTSGFIAGTASPTTDSHSYARASIDTRTLTSGSFTLVYRQNFLMNDRRTGVTGRVVQNCGFTITHTVSFSGPAPSPGPAPGTGSGGRSRSPGTWHHQTVKAGAAVTVGGIAATAGSGSATSDSHTL